MEEAESGAAGFELQTLSEPQNRASTTDTTSRNNLDEDLKKECSVGNFDAVWMLLYGGAGNIRECIRLSIKHEHYKVTALLLICHAIFNEDIPMLENLLNDKANFKQLVEFLPSDFAVFHKVITCLKDMKDDFTKAAIQVAMSLETVKSIEVLKCLLLNTHCQERYGKVNWKNLLLERFHESWLKPIETWVQDLNLSGNKLTSVPRKVCNMKYLTQLNLSANHLDVITRKIFTLPSLRHLNISRNNLQKLPEFPAQGKPALKSLNVSDNKLKALPQSITRATLEFLNLSKNSFTEVPLCVCEITTLKELDLSYNREISSLPDAMGILRNLCYLGLTNLDKITDPLKKMRGNAQDVVSFLRTKLRSCQPYYTMKLMLVGKAGQGKTTLLHRLQDDYSYNDDDFTHGVEINDLVIKKSAFDKKFNFKVWDFGGQEDYYATHQCFLSTMSLYLLVWRLTDGEEGVNGLTPWLDNIAVRSPGSTVIVVGTHLDCIKPENHGQGYVDHLKNMVYQLARKPRYKKIVVPTNAICAVSCGSTKNRSEISKLRRVIYETAANLKKGNTPVMGELIPCSYFSLIDRIERRKLEMLSKKEPPIIRKEEFHAMVKQNAQLCKKDIEDPLDVRDATVFLRERGIVLHFDDPNDDLHDLYFIDPHWLCAQMSRVLMIKRHTDLFREGIVELHETEESLQEDDIPMELRTQIIRLLIKFQVVCPLDQSRILVPSQLPEKKPEDVEKLSLPFVPVRRVYEIDYQRIHGFWTRFMSRLFLYMKEMITVDPTRHQRSEGGEHGDGMARFCRSCVAIVKPSSGTFPCFLERNLSKKSKTAAGKKKSNITRSSSMSCFAPMRHELDSTPSLDMYPSVKIFSEDELGEDVDDDVVGIVINNMDIAMDTGGDAHNGKSLEFENGYVVLKRQKSVERARAAMYLRVPSYDDEARIPKVNASEFESSRESSESSRESSETQEDTYRRDYFKRQAGNSKETQGDSNHKEHEFGTDRKLPTYDEKQSAVDGRRTINPDENPTKYENDYTDDGISWRDKEDRPTTNEHRAASSDSPLSQTIRREEQECVSGLNEGITREELVNTSIASSISIVLQQNAGESCGCSPEHKQSSVSTTTTSPSSRQPEYDFLKTEPFLQESANINTVRIKERFSDNNNAQGSETRNHETMEDFRKSENLTPDVISECPPSESLARIGSTGVDGKETLEVECAETRAEYRRYFVHEQLLKNRSNSRIRNNLYIALDNIEINVSGSPTGGFMPRPGHTVDSITKDLPNAVNHAAHINAVNCFGTTCAENAKTPSTLPLSTYQKDSRNVKSHPKTGSPPLHASAMHSGIADDATEDAHEKVRSEFPSTAVATDVCALCEENTPVDQLVAIPLDVAELMERNYLRCWRSGMCLNHPNVFLAVSNRSLSDTVVIETAVSPSHLGRCFLTFVVDHLDTLIKEWYPGLLVSFDAEPAVQKLIPCRLCEETGVREQHVFTFDSCITQCSVGDFVKCPEHEVSIQDIAPDVVLHDLDPRFILDDDEIQYDKTEENKLGGGSFGAVYQGFCRGKPAAIKEFSSSDDERGATKQYSEIRKEVNVMRHIGEHPFLVNLIGVCLRPFRLVLELADKGSLAKKLTNPNFFIDRVVVYRMVYQVAEALSFLHSLNVIYRDLKPGNILVMSYEEQNDVNIKLTDFGTATFKFSEGLFSVQGTPGHHAPEMLVSPSQRSGYNDKVDVFSLGMLIYSFITRRRPFSNITSLAEINSMISQGEKPKYDDMLVSRIGLAPLTWLMEKCLQFDPNLRPSSKMVATQVCSPSFQLLLGMTTFPCSQSVHHVCIVEATRELWVAAGDKSRGMVLVYELKSMSIKEKISVASRFPSVPSSALQVSSMHATAKSVLIGLRGDLVTIYDVGTYRLKAKIALRQPVLCMSSNENYILLGTSSGLLLVIPTSVEGIPETIKVSDDPVRSMVVVDDCLWLACNNCIYIYNTKPGENTRPFELLAIRYSQGTSSVTIAIASKHMKAIWCACKASSVVVCWDVTKRQETCRIDCESALRRVSTNKFLTAFEQCVTCVVSALDTVWVGTGGGMLLIFHVTSGELITWMHLFDDSVRTLTLVPEPGPYSLERCYVIASGGKTHEAALSCGGKVVCPLVAEAENKPLPKKTRPLKTRTNSLSRLRRKFHRRKSPVADNTEKNDAGSLLLLEVLPSEILRRIEAKSPR